MSFSENNNDDNPWDVKEDSGSSSSSKEKNIFEQRFKRTSSKKPKDFADIFEDLQKRFKNGGNSGGGAPQASKGLILVIATIFVALWFSSGFFLVQEGEVAVVLRFGKVVRTSSHAGLHYRLPYPVEQEVIRNVVEVHQIDSTVSHSGEGADQNLILTGDENMVLTDYTVQWNIKDLNQYLFIMRNPEATIRAAAESALREVIGQTTARLALTEGREEIGNKTQILLQKILDMYNSGVQIISFKLQKVEPPSQVVDAFNDMQASRVDADRSSNEAQAYSNDILPKARGQAESILRAAEAYSAEIVAKAEGEAARFIKIYESYKKDPVVTRIRMHREMLEGLLKQGVITVIDKDLGHTLQNYNQLIPASVLNKKEGA